MGATEHTDAGEDGQSERAQVLEFELGTETYCVDIEYVAEIVDRGGLTPVPNTPAHVQGVIDLRGRTTSVLDPKTALGIEGGAGERIVVLDPERLPEGEALGWIVDAVRQVVDVDPGLVDEAPVGDDDAVRGVLKRDDGFVVWLDPTELS
jgi:purine-binding chemotaxis protein CheW